MAEMTAVLGFVVFVIGAILIFSNLVQGRGKWTQAFEKIATRYGGWYRSARLTRPPAAAFRYKGSDCRVRCRRHTGKRGRRDTEFRIAWPQKNDRLEITPAGSGPEIRALRGTAPQPTGDGAFDSGFHVFTGRKMPDIGTRLLSSGVRWQIHQLATFLNHVPVRVLMDRGLLIIRKNCFVKNDQNLDDFVRYCLELHDQLMLTTSEGIEFQDEVLMTAVDDVHCPICSSEIEGKMVICVRCKTPHCLECWQYNVKCGMYACNETRFMIVGSQTA